MTDLPSFYNLGLHQLFIYFKMKILSFLIIDHCDVEVEYDRRDGRFVVPFARDNALRDCTFRQQTADTAVIAWVNNLMLCNCHPSDPCTLLGHAVVPFLGKNGTFST